MTGAGRGAAAGLPGLPSAVPSEAAGPAPDVALAVVGLIVPDEPRFHGPAFSRAAQMFSDELLLGLSAAGLTPDAIFSMEPIPVFRHSGRLFGRSEVTATSSGLPVRLLPFLNMQPFKALTVGAATFFALLRWSWKHRHCSRVIHCINLSMPPGGFALLAGRLTGARMVLSVLDVWKPGGIVPDTLFWRVDFWLQKRLIPRFDGLMVVSQAIADDFAPGRPVCRLEGGVARAQFELPPPVPRSSQFRIVLSGSLQPYNGVEVVLDAMALLPPDVELVVAGAGPLESLVRERAARDPRIVPRGFLGFRETLQLYTSADLLLNTRLTRELDTRYFFPSKLMEMLASGTPVLSTCTGHVEQDYGSLLYLLRDEAPAGLARRILEIAAEDPEARRALGQRARDFMLAERTWERQTARFARYIRQEVLGVAP